MAGENEVLSSTNRVLEDLENSAAWQAVGKTPLVNLRGIAPGSTKFFGKLEGMNPGGSVKDRVAKAMLCRAVAEGRVRSGSTVIESSSGNTAVGLASLCAVASIKMLAVVDPRTTPTNLKLLKAYGAGVVMITSPDAATGEFLPARLAKVKELVAEHPGAFWPDQYSNPAVLDAHVNGTMPEIAQQLGEAPDYLYVPASTCGTLAGCSLFLRQNNWPTRLVAVDVYGSRIFGDKFSGVKRSLPGMGAPFVPPFASDVDTWRTEYVSEIDCINSCRELASSNGILVGASSGGVLSAARRVAAESSAGSTHVLLFPDRGERYLNSVFLDGPE